MNAHHYLYDLKRSMEANGWVYDSTVDDTVALRNAGHTFTMSEHIRAMVFALLSNRTPWKRIKRKVEKIDEIFNGYNPETIKLTKPEVYTAAIRKERCGNQNIKKQMADLAYNIGVLEYLQTTYGSVDAFLTSRPAAEIVELLSAPKHKRTKLKQMGPALVWEYIRVWT